MKLPETTLAIMRIAAARGIATLPDHLDAQFVEVDGTPALRLIFTWNNGDVVEIDTRELPQELLAQMDVARDLLTVAEPIAEPPRH